MEGRWNGLTCAVAAQVATLTTTAGVTQAMPSTLALAGGGIVVNLTANVGELFEASDARYTVIIRKET